MFDTAAKSMFATTESLAQVLVLKQRASAGVHNLASASALQVRKSFQHLFLNAGQARRVPKVFAGCNCRIAQVLASTQGASVGQRERFKAPTERFTFL